MNKEIVSFQLSQAIEQLVKLKKNVADDAFRQNGDIAYAVQVATALNYICNSWHFKDMTLEDVSSLSNEEYEAYAFKVPFFDPRFKME